MTYDKKSEYSTEGKIESIITEKKSIYKKKELKRNINRIMLISPPGKITLTKEGSRERKLAVPPLGLAYMAASLKKAGYEVNILDTLVEGYNNENANDSTIIYGLDDNAIKKKVLEFNPDLIGVSCIFSNRSAEALNICRIAKTTIPDVHVLLGGQHPTGMPELINEKNVDYILSGETDNSILQLIKTVNANDNLLEIDGIIIKRGEKIYKNSKRDYPDVKILPYPSWELLDMNKYWNIGMSDYEVNQKSIKKFMILISSRGCPHSCYFCTASLMSGRRYREREIDDVVSEIGLYKEKYGISEVHFWDDNFFVNKQRLKKLLIRLMQEFPEMEFQSPSGSEINALDEEVIELLAKAGFKKVFLAVESPNEEIQDKLIDKRVDLKRIPYLIKIIHKHGMIAEGSFMVGFPGETKEQIDNTFKSVKTFNFDRISISIVNPLPGTSLFDKCREENLFYDDFDVRNIRWSSENIRLKGIEKGYLSMMRRKVWLEYMNDRIDIEKYETEKVRGKFIK